MATEVTKFPAKDLGKSFWQELDEAISMLIDIGHITTASTVEELQTAITGELDNDDPRS